MTNPNTIYAIAVIAIGNATNGADVLKYCAGVVPQDMLAKITQSLYMQICAPTVQPLIREPITRKIFTSKDTPNGTTIGKRIVDNVQ